MQKAPAFMFYAKDWLTDLRVRSMTPSQKGYYIDLLATMWLEDGKLPADKNMLQGLTGASEDDISKVIECFQVKEIDGIEYYVQKRMVHEQEKQRKHRAQRKKAIESRWEGHKKKGKLSAKERKELLERKAKEFRDTLNTYYKNNKKKYPKDMYHEFFQYWGVPNNTKQPQTLVWENQKSWNLPQRLATWHKNYVKDHPEAEVVKSSSVIKPVNMDD